MATAEQKIHVTEFTNELFIDPSPKTVSAWRTR